MKVGQRVEVNYPPNYVAARGEIVEKRKWIGEPYLVALDDGRCSRFGPADLKRLDAVVDTRMEGVGA